MNNIFLIYEYVPEETKFYLLSQLNNDEYCKIIECHGSFINNSNNDEDIDNQLNWLLDFLSDKDHLIYAQGNPFFLENKERIAIVHTGFLL